MIEKIIIYMIIAGFNVFMSQIIFRREPFTKRMKYGILSFGIYIFLVAIIHIVVD